MTPEQEQRLTEIGEHLDYVKSHNLSPSRMEEWLEFLFEFSRSTIAERDEARREAERLADELSGIQYREFAVNETFKDIRKSNALPWEKDAT